MTQMDDSLRRSQENFTDCAGVVRRFGLKVELLVEHGYAAQAIELPPRESGYEFKAFAGSSPELALARLRSKIRQGLAQRFLVQEGESLEMPFERLRGRIDSEGVVVDGRLVAWKEFIVLMRTHQGWEFDLHIPLEPT